MLLCPFLTSKTLRLIFSLCWFENIYFASHDKLFGPDVFTFASGMISTRKPTCSSERFQLKLRISDRRVVFCLGCRHPVRHVRFNTSTLVTANIPDDKSPRGACITDDDLTAHRRSLISLLHCSSSSSSLDSLDLVTASPSYFPQSPKVCVK